MTRKLRPGYFHVELLGQTIVAAGDAVVGYAGDLTSLLHVREVGYRQPRQYWPHRESRDAQRVDATSYAAAPCTNCSPSTHQPPGGTRPPAHWFLARYRSRQTETHLSSVCAIPFPRI